MKKINVYEVGNVVRLSPVWVALNAAKSSSCDVDAHIGLAKLTMGVVVDVTMHSDLVPRYFVKWKSYVHPNKVAWFEHDELVSINAKVDWDNIPLEKYAADERSVNNKQNMEFARELRAEIKAAMERSIIEAETAAQG